MIRFDLVLFGLACLTRSVWCDWVWLRLIRLSLGLFGLVSSYFVCLGFFALVLCDSVWFSLIWLNMGLFGLIWSYSVKFGLIRFGFV